MNSWFKLFGGFALLAFGIWLLLYMIKETKNGYRSRFGNDIGLYFAAILAIITALFIIYQEGIMSPL